MPKLAELFLRFKKKDEVFVDGTVEVALSVPHTLVPKIEMIT
jgi:hypothetical protein